MWLKPPNEAVKPRQMKLTVTAYSRQRSRCVKGYTRFYTPCTFIASTPCRAGAFGRQHRKQPGGSLNTALGAPVGKPPIEPANDRRTKLTVAASLTSKVKTNPTTEGHQ